MPAYRNSLWTQKCWVPSFVRNVQYGCLAFRHCRMQFGTCTYWATFITSKDLSSHRLSLLHHHSFSMAKVQSGTHMDPEQWFFFLLKSFFLCNIMCFSITILRFFSSCHSLFNAFFSEYIIIFFTSHFFFTRPTFYPCLAWREGSKMRVQRQRDLHVICIQGKTSLPNRQVSVQHRGMAASPIL